MKDQIYLNKTRKSKCLKRPTCSLHVQEPKMFCRKRGEEVKEIGNFCCKCGQKQKQKAVTEKEEVKTLSLDFYKHFKREE